MLTEWKGRQITDISRADIRDCIDSIMQRGAIAMAARAFRVIRAMFNWCVGRGLIETSPCVGLVPPPTGRPRERFLSDDELAAVLRTAMAIPGHYGAIVMMLALTGQRRSEVANMRWEELDLEKGIWTLPAKRTKARRSHAVHLTPEMLALLPEREDDQPLVFSSPSGKPFQAFGQMKERHDKASGVSDWVIHDLRRTSPAAWLHVAHVADKILNHQSGAISGIAAVYQRHQFMAERKAAIELWSRHMAAILRMQNGSKPASGRAEYTPAHNVENANATPQQKSPIS